MPITTRFIYCALVSKKGAPLRIMGLSLLLIAAMAAPSWAQTPDWDVDPTRYENTMTMTATVEVSGDLLGATGDQLAVFLGPDVRGVAVPTQDVDASGTDLFFLTIYGNAGDVDQPLSFSAYDASTDSVFALTPSLPFEINGEEGTPGAPFRLEGGDTSLPDPTGWIVDPEAYESSMTVTADVIPGADRVEGAADQLAAFVSGEIRGVTSPTEVDGEWIYFLTVYGDAPDTGASVQYAYLHDASGYVFEPPERGTFELDDIVGDLASPVSIVVEHPVPVINQIQPAVLTQGDSVQVQFQGRGFVPGITRLSLSGTALETASFQVESPTEATVSVYTTRETSAGGRTFSLANGAPGGGISESVLFTVTEDPLGFAPTNPQAASIKDRIRLEWTPPADGSFTYNVYRSTAPFQSPLNATRLNAAPLTERTYDDYAVTSGTRYYYRFTAIDADGGESVLSIGTSVFFYAETIVASIRRTLGDASGPEDYRLVALPGNVQRSVAGAVGDAQEWRAYWDDGSTSDFLIPYDGSDLFRFAPGRGFWLTSPQAWNVDVSTATVPLRGDSVAVIDVHDGWNIISNPTDKDVAWRDVDAQYPQERLQRPWAFDGAFQQTEVFASATEGEAFYFLNTTGLDSLVIPYATASTKADEKASDKISERRALAAHETEESPAALSVTFESSTGLTTDVAVGFHPEASVGRDARDQMAPPQDFLPFHATLSGATSSERPKISSSRTQSIAVDWRPSPDEGGVAYDVVLATGGAATAWVTADIPPALSGFEIALLDPESGRSFSLGADPVVVDLLDDRHSLQLVVGTEAYVTTRRDAVTPAEVTLTTYPNPVRHRATFEFTLPEASPVRLVVYDVLGREVAQIAEGSHTPGRHRVRMPTDRLASGLYFGRLETGQRTITRKIVVVR